METKNCVACGREFYPDIYLNDCCSEGCLVDFEYHTNTLDNLKYHACLPVDRAPEYDGYGIFLCYTCQKCYDEKMSQYRTDIHTQYECEEPVYDEGDF